MKNKSKLFLSISNTQVLIILPMILLTSSTNPAFNMETEFLGSRCLGKLAEKTLKKLALFIRKSIRASNRMWGRCLFWPIIIGLFGLSGRNQPSRVQLFALIGMGSQGWNYLTIISRSMIIDLILLYD